MLSEKQVLSTTKFAEKILEMECCMFCFKIDSSNILFTITKQNLSTKLLIILMNEYQDRDDEKNYSMIFEVEGYDSDDGIYDKKLALKSIIKGLNTYTEMIKLNKDSWVWNDKYYAGRVLVDVSYSEPN